MKLAFCLFNYFPYGGLQRDFMQIAQCSHEKGHEIHVFTQTWQGQVPPHFILHELKPSVFALQNHTRARQFVHQLIAQLNGQYDVVIGFNKMPGLDIYFAADGCYAEKISRKPPSFIHHLLPRNKTFLALESSIFNQHSNTKIIYISSNNKRSYNSMYNLNQENQFLLPPGIGGHFKTLPLKKIVYRSHRQQLHLNQNKYHLLMIASHFKTKGLDRAIIALSQLPSELQHNLQFNIIGDDTRDEFVKLAKRLRVNAAIKYHGAKDNIADWMQAADLLLHPAYEESAGLTLLEALAAGLPIITTAACGYASYIEDANAGIVIPEPYSQQALNDALYILLSSSNRLDTFSENASHFAKHSDFYNLAPRALQIIEEVGCSNARTIT